MPHTPGPWRVMHLNKQLPFVDRMGTYEIWTDGYTVVAQNPKAGPIRNEADARLIAAAPETKQQRDELLKALTWIMHLHHDIGKDGNMNVSDSEWREALCSGRDAIANATGWRT